MNGSTPFWKTKALHELNSEEWESLCDGCAKCCLIKLEDEDTAEVFYTDVVCHLLDQDTCRCTEYEDRKRLVPSCVRLRPDNLEALSWMPSTCAYRLVFEGQDLPKWHHLVCGDGHEVHKAGISVRGRATSEANVDDKDLPHRLTDWD